MCVLYLAPLLALLSVGTAVPAPEDCGHLVKLLPPEDQHTIFGKWIFIEGFSDHEMFNALLRKTNSSWIEIFPTSHTETVLLNQGNLIDGKCLNSSTNMTFSKNSLQVSQNNVTSTGHFLLSCPDCLVMHFSSTMDEVHIRSLYIFGKTRTLPEAELKPFRKQAECLQYPQPAQYSYDGVTDKDEPPHHPDMIQLYERLLAAEFKGELLSRELSSVLTSLRNLTISNNNSSTNIPEGPIKRNLSLLSSRLPNAYLYLPHLRDHPDSLIPNVVLGQGRTGVSLVLGIPTVKRQKQSYLVSTLNSLLYDFSPSERNDTVIIIFVAETDAEYVNSVAELLEMNFSKDVHSGLLEVVSPSQYFYPNFSRLRETFGDSKERVKWRTKQNLDYSFLMLYAQEKGTYYVQLEDDIVANPGYSQTMKTYVRNLATDDWMFLEFSQLGFIGKMFRARDLPMIAEFFLMFYKDKPIDWLLDHILWVKACNPEKDAKDCNLQKGLLKLRYKPSLFQHVGLHSSLSGKLQKLKDKDFGKMPLFAAHTNPPAELSSSLKHYQQHTLERAYKGQDFFWGLTPTAKDFILLSFPQPRTVTRYLFRSGNIENNGDKFYNTTVAVLPSDSSVRDRLVGGQSPQYKGSYGGFIVIGCFVDGVAEGQIDAQMQPISALRLLVHSDSDMWVLLSEIFIQL